jgi:hypothetical protein
MGLITTLIRGIGRDKQEFKEKFKDVTDDPALIFQAAESIKVTKNGVPQFGTRDFQWVDDMSEAKAMADTGYEVIREPNGDPALEFIDGINNISEQRRRQEDFVSIITFDYFLSNRIILFIKF